MIVRDKQFYKFSAYGFLKNLRFFDPFIILFFREMGMSFLQIGVLFSIREVSTNILEIPTGVFADAYGRRKSMIFSFLSYIVSFCIFYFLPIFWMYAVAMVCFAFGEAFRTGTHKAMIMEYLRLKNMTDFKVEYYGHTRGASQMGSAVSSLIAAALVFYIGGYRIVFLASVVPYVFGLFLMMSYPKELDGTESRSERQSGAMLSQIRETLKSFLKMFSNRQVVKALFNSAVYDAFHKTVKDYLQPILKALVISLPVMLSLQQGQRIAVLVGITYFLIYLLTSYASRKSSLFVKKTASLKRAVNATFLMGAVVLIATGVFTRTNFQIVAVFLFLLLYVIENLRRPIMVSYISDRIANDVMATGLSAESQLKTVLMAALAPAIGYLVDRFGLGNALIIAGMTMIGTSFALKIE